MINILVIYLAFLGIYDHWATDAVNWQIAWFAAHYLFVAAVAFDQVRQGRAVVVSSIITLIMITLSINELTWINSTKEVYTAMRSGPPALGLTIAVVFIYIFLTVSKKMQWAKLRTIGR